MTSERKSFCIESLLSREGVVGGGRHTVSPADVGGGGEGSPGPTTPPLASSPAAMPGRPTFLGPSAPLMPPHLYPYPGIGVGVPPALLPAHAFTPTSSPLLDAHAFTALKSGAAALPPAALDWFTRAGLLYPRLPHELAGEYTTHVHILVHMS